jgi:hypothetical protein
MRQTLTLGLAFVTACGSPLQATVHEEVVTEALDPDAYDARLEDAAGRMPAAASVLRLVRPDGTPVEPSRAPLQIDKYAHQTQRPPPADNPGRADGFLSGRAVYMSQCHGWLYSEVLGRFATQRGDVWDTVEDFHNPEGANVYLLNYLENAGAAVYTARERGMNTNQALSDDSDATYSEVGTDFIEGDPGFADAAPYPYGVNPFSQGTTRRFPADGGSVATWVPNIPEAGYYAVYVSWDGAPDNTTSAHYQLEHPGGTIDRYFDQTVHGSTWQYVERLWLDQGESLSLSLIGDSPEAGTWLSADAVRVGGGMGDVERVGDLTGRPRWESSAVLYNQYNGAPTYVYDPWGDGDGSDPSTRSLWADWEHPPSEDAVYLSWHSNASGGGDARGTVTYFAGGGPDAPADHPAACNYSGEAIEGSYTLANLVQTELVAAFVDRWDPNWQDRGVNEACFSEVNPSYNDEMPAALVELAFHDNYDDTLYLKHPRFRDDSSRAMYRGVVRYFAERDGVPAVFLPEPPETVALTHGEDGLLHLTWSMGSSGAPLGDAATGYLVALSRDGRAWDTGTPIAGTEAVILAAPGTPVFARVIATNAGGLSFPSITVGARQSPTGAAPVLVINAFDRLDRGLLEFVDVPNVGDIDRFDIHRTNDESLIATHGQAISAAGWYFDSASDEAAALLNLSAYDAVVWSAAEESFVDQSFSPEQQIDIRTYWENGGALWVSGSEILWDLDALGDNDDLAFATEVLGSTMAADASASMNVDGEGILASVGPMDFDMTDGAPYPVEWPDVLDTDRAVVARYGGTEVAASVGDGVAMFGFPFECIGDPGTRIAVAGAILAELVPGDVPDDIPPDPNDLPRVVDPDDVGSTTPTGDDTTTGESTPSPDNDGSPRVPISELGGCGCNSNAASEVGVVMLASMIALWRRRERLA